MSTSFSIIETDVTFLSNIKSTICKLISLTFSKEYNLTLIVYDSAKTIIPEEEYSIYSYERIINQAKAAGSQVITGSSLSITIDAVYIPRIELEEETEITE